MKLPSATSSQATDYYSELQDAKAHKKLFVLASYRVGLGKYRLNGQDTGRSFQMYKLAMVEGII